MVRDKPKRLDIEPVEGKSARKVGRQSSHRHGRNAPGRRRLFSTLVGFVILLTMFALSAMWLGSRAVIVRNNLESIESSITDLVRDIDSGGDLSEYVRVAELQRSSAAAKEAATDPLWKIATSLPWLGANFAAVTETTLSVDDIVNRAVLPILVDPQALDLAKFGPVNGAMDIQRIQQYSPKLVSVARVVRLSQEKIKAIDKSELIPEIAEPLETYTEKLHEISASLDSAADTVQLLPDMLGAKSARHYLLMVQNNAESRASGGIPGALAVLTVDQGRFTMGEQNSAGALGTTAPLVPVDPQQQAIFSTRLGKYMQDVNLTPDFPTAAGTAQRIWEQKTGRRVDGVISIDPVALSYVLEATGPIQVKAPYMREPAGVGLPNELTSQNLVRTLLSDVYASIDEPRLQDAYFAGVAQEVFSALTSGKGGSKSVFKRLADGVTEGRILLWADNANEQSVVANYPIGGSVEGPSVAAAQYGVYFNDGTGAKMDYYVQRTVQLIKECPRDGYQETTVRITNTNTAPADAATSLPPYVTGAGAFGIPPGSVQTNIVAYGPAQANVERAKLDGQRAVFAPYRHGSRPVAVMAVRLAPGESKTVDFTFGRVVQHTEPNLVVTPTVQSVNDVMLATASTACA